MRTKPRQSLRKFFIATIVLVSLAVPVLARAETPSLELSQPVRVESQVEMDFKLLNMFDDDLLATLKSGLPAIFTFRWTIWQERSGQRDLEASTGRIHYRIFFDVLEEDYNIFNVQGRPLAACETLLGVESVVCNQEGLVLAESSALSHDNSYHVEMEVIIEAIGDDQVRGFENWLRNRTDVPEEEENSLTAGLNSVFRGLIRNIAGIQDRRITGQSPSFRGW